MTKNDSGIVSDIAAHGARSSESVLTPAVDPASSGRAGERGEPVPDLRRTEAALETRRARSASVVIVAVLAVLYTLYFARDFFIPIVFAVLLNFLLSPVLRTLARL
ncbi:MAG TPA: hypothetical protein VII52_11035, partial [Gemmatimonadaceae bacterium]